MNNNDAVIYSVKTQHVSVINTINLATCFGSLNHLQANSQNKGHSSELYIPVTVHRNRFLFK